MNSYAAAAISGLIIAVIICWPFIMEEFRKGHGKLYNPLPKIANQPHETFRECVTCRNIFEGNVRGTNICPKCFDNRSCVVPPPKKVHKSG